MATNRSWQRALLAAAIASAAGLAMKPAITDQPHAAAKLNPLSATTSDHASPDSSAVITSSSSRPRSSTLSAAATSSSSTSWRSAPTNRPLTRFNSAFYEVSTDLDPREARELAEHADAVYRGFASKLPGLHVRNGAQNERVRLLLFRDRNTYIEQLAANGVNGAHTGGFFFVRGDDAGLALWTGGRSRLDLIQTLQHEAFHQVAHHRIGQIPPWVNEGLAEYFGDAIAVSATLRTGRVDPERLDRLRAARRAGLLFPVAQLLAMPQEEWNDILFSGSDRAGIMYDQAWSVIHFLLEADNGSRSGALHKYLQHLSRNDSPQESLRRTFGSNLRELESAWARHLDNLQPDGLSTAIERLDFIASGIRWLDRQNVRPTTLDELRAELVDRGYFLRRSRHGLIREIRAEDPDAFQPPPVGRHNTARISLQSSTDRNTPPAPIINGLSPAPRTIEVRWRREHDGSLNYEFHFR